MPLDALHIGQGLPGPGAVAGAGAVIPWLVRVRFTHPSGVVASIAADIPDRPGDLSCSSGQAVGIVVGHARFRRLLRIVQPPQRATISRLGYCGAYASHAPIASVALVL